MRITVDGPLVAERYDGAALTLDPGEHTFRFDAAGKAGFEKIFRLAQGERERQERIVFDEPPVPRVLPAVTVGSEHDTSPSALRTAGLVIAAGGLGGLATGSVLGLLAMAKNSQAHCDAKNVCADPQERRDAQGIAVGSTIAFVAGGALVAGGAALFLIAPRSDGRPAPKVGLLPALSVHSAGMALEGTW